jgi:hypothetical protein
MVSLNSNKRFAGFPAATLSILPIFLFTCPVYLRISMMYDRSNELGGASLDTHRKRSVPAERMQGA